MIGQSAPNLRRAATRAVVAISVAFVLLIPAPVAAGRAAPLVFNARDGFQVSPNQANPSGVWSYREKHKDGTYPLLTNFDASLSDVDGMEGWFGSEGPPWYLPAVWYNNSGIDQPVCCPTSPLPAGGLFAHPGGSYPVVIRWTSPRAGVVSIRLGLIDRDMLLGDGIAWSIGKPHHPVVSGAFGNGGQLEPIVIRIRVQAHDRIDLKINRGPTTNSADTTQVDETITLYPN